MTGDGLGSGATGTRIERMAQILVKYSLALRAQDVLRIEAPSSAEPLVLAVAQQALDAGACLLPRISLARLSELILERAGERQLSYVPDAEWNEINSITARLAIGAEASAATKTVGPHRLAVLHRARAPLQDRLRERKAKGELRSCVTQFPTSGYADRAGMLLSEYEDLFYRACFLDEHDPVAAWAELSKFQAGLCDRLSRIRQLRIQGVGTELVLSVAGRSWINSDGHSNFPSGEVFTAPIEPSASGTIQFDFPATYAGSRVTDIRLVFEFGRVVSATASSGEEALQALLETDPGARFVGEIAFGTNPKIEHFTCNTLLDEKIGGTVHLALGASYPECGGSNRSAIHWDLVKDLRAEGQVWGDGELLFANGEFL